MTSCDLDVFRVMKSNRTLYMIRHLKRYSSIDFDDIWQKYSKDSRIEFACFSFHAGLFF